MTFDLTRRKVLAVGGAGAAGVGVGAYSFINGLDTGRDPSGDSSPLRWIGDDMGWNNDAGNWQGFYCWDQPAYERLKGDLAEKATREWDIGPLIRHPSKIVRDAISVESFLGSGVAMATTGTVDTDTLLSKNFPAPRIRRRLQSDGNSVDISVEQVKTYRGLDIYRQQFTDAPHVRAIAMNDSMIIMTNVYERDQVAVDWATDLADNWMDDQGSLSKTSDAFDHFRSLLNPGFVTSIGFLPSNNLLGGTMSVEDGTGILREVMLAPDVLSDDCVDSYRQSLETMLDRLPAFDGDTDASLEIVDGAGVIELSIPVDELYPGLGLTSLTNQGVYLMDSDAC